MCFPGDAVVEGLSVVVAMVVTVMTVVAVVTSVYGRDRRAAVVVPMVMVVAGAESH